MYKYYVRLNLSFTNVKFKQNDFIFGIPGPLTAISYLKALSLKINSDLEDNKVLISYLNSVENKASSNAYNQKSFNHTKEVKTIFGNPTGFLNLILIATFVTEDKASIFKQKLMSNLLKLRYNGGVIQYESIDSFEKNIQIEESISKLKNPFGFIALSAKEKINSIEDIVLTDKIKGFKKEIINIAVVGVNKNLQTTNDLSYYNKEHFFGESVVGKIKYISFKKMNLNEMDLKFFNNNSWSVYENDACLYVETLHKI